MLRKPYSDEVKEGGISVGERRRVATYDNCYGSAVCADPDVELCSVSPARSLRTKDKQSK